MIFLTDEERNYLEYILKSQSKYWVCDSILGKIKADEEEKEKIAQCDHKKANFTGKKTCCSKCMAFVDEGDSETWKNTKRIKK